MVKRYTAEIKPVNEDVIGSTVFGEAELVEDGDTLRIKIKATGTPPNMMHWSHFQLGRGICLVFLYLSIE